MPPIQAQARLAQVSSGESEIEQSVDSVARDLVALGDKLEIDLELALNGARFREVPVVGPGEAGLTQTQILGAVDTVASRLEAVVLKILQPPLGPYVTPASTELLSSVDAKMKEIRQRAGEFQESPGDKSGVVEDYVDTYLGPVTSVIRAVEELVVTRENENIPVYENDEKNGGLGFWKVTLVAGVLVGLIALGTYSAKQTEI